MNSLNLRLVREFHGAIIRALTIYELINDPLKRLRAYRLKRNFNRWLAFIFHNRVRVPVYSLVFKR